MNNKVMLRKLKVCLLIPLGIVLVYISSKRPALVEKLYSEVMYRPIGMMLSRVTGILPFSVAELIVILVPAAFIIYTAKVLIMTISHRGVNFMPLLEYMTNILMIVSITFFVFLGIWGLNYYRMPFASVAGLEVKPASVEELESVCEALIERANVLRSKVCVDAEGNMDIPGSSRDILNSCYKGYEAISNKYPYLGGSYGDPKPVLLSRLMNYTGICGIYFPFTGEANVNVAIPDSFLPCTAAPC